MFDFLFIQFNREKQGSEEDLSIRLIRLNLAWDVLIKLKFVSANYKGLSRFPSNYLHLYNLLEIMVLKLLLMSNCNSPFVCGNRLRHLFLEGFWIIYGLVFIYFSVQGWKRSFRLPLWRVWASHPQCREFRLTTLLLFYLMLREYPKIIVVGPLLVVTLLSVTLAVNPFSARRCAVQKLVQEPTQEFIHLCSTPSVTFVLLLR